MIDLSAVSPDSGNEPRIFRPSREYLYGELWSLILTLISFPGIGILIVLDDPFNMHLSGFLFVGSLGLLPGLIALWGIMVYRNVSLTLHNNIVTLQEVFQRQEVNLSEVTEARWGSDSELFLNPRPDSVVINLKYYHLEDRLWLIRYFHRELKETDQIHWNQFCFQVAIPLEERLQLIKHPEMELRTPGSEKILITRRRYDRIGIPLNAVLTPTVILISWYQGQFGFLILPAMTIGWWLFLRYSIPKRGIIQERIWARENFRVMTYLLVAWGSAGLIGFVILLRTELPELVKVIGGLCLFLLCLELILKMYNSATIHCQEERQKKKAEAVQRWEAGQKTDLS